SATGNTRKYENLLLMGVISDRRRRLSSSTEVRGRPLSDGIWSGFVGGSGFAPIVTSSRQPRLTQPSLTQPSAPIMLEFAFRAALHSGIRRGAFRRLLRRGVGPRTPTPLAGVRFLRLRGPSLAPVRGESDY